MKTIVPEGYQETKLGFVPKDWNIVKLRDIATKCTKKNTDESITTVFSNSAVNGIVLQNEYFNKDIAQQGNLDGYYIVESGDFVYNPRISNNAPAGPINRNLHTQTGVVSPLYTVFRSKSNEQTNFLEHFFKSTKWLKYMMSIANYGARHDRMNVTSDDFFDMPIPMPKDQEQTKIAEILTTWDEAITKQEELIKAKELQKKGLMQKLLSGKVRFSGFTDEWEEVRLGEIGEFKTSSIDKIINENERLVNLINYMDVYRNKHIDKNFRCSKTSLKEEQYEKVNLKKGDILFTPSSETPDDIGHSAVIIEDLPNTVYSYHLVRFRPKKSIDLKFSGYVFNNIDILKEFAKRANGSTRFTLSIKDFNETKAKLPSLPEQHKIAEVLSLADDEINLLKNELEELKLQKKALMQKLLTGEVRVKV
ncbi:restriction endonuclease subunit S [Aliarcobacter skirrowii]|uniref:restriction endonuclease subunit S n=1 Tax=Aliarcobacter skirrowii TaxID=28200 RepID=UPI0029A70C52|nr:restriction endonuclease subunit S [Aliarcobacter skirrowii]MDX4026592.1 restriction endonuclease subunit S [Aliarcobacter skirrowii]